VSRVGFASAVTSGRVGGFGFGSSLYCTVWGDELDGSRSGSASSVWGRLGGQRGSGACRGEWLVVGQHVPDRFGRLASDRQGSALAAALLPVSGTVALEGRLVERVAAGGVGCFDERPTWMGPAGQGRRSTRSDAVDVSGARWVALPYIGARGSGAGDRIGAATVHSNAGQHGCARRYVGTRRKLFHWWGRCSHGIGQAACSRSARTW
jgi:hypothetical protein